MNTIHVNGSYGALRAAGKPYHGRDEGVAHSLKDPEHTLTPEHVACFRVPLEPGSRVRHKGAPRLDDDHSDLVHGAFFKGPAAHASDVLDLALPPLADFQRQRAEETFYRSVREAPLGRGYTTGGLVLPASASAPGHAFGAPSVKGDAAKDIIAPLPQSAEDAAREAQLYERSHHAHGPGVQRKGGLDWAATQVGDPKSATFGRPTRTEYGAVAAALGRAPQGGGSSVLVPKSVQDHHDTCDDPLGGARGKAVARAAEAAGGGPLSATGLAASTRVFGAPSGRAGGPGAGAASVAECLRGAEGDDADAMQDADLGKSYRRGRPGRVGEISGDPTRRFGVPSVRSDVPPRTRQSIATRMDFGGGPSAAQLLQPSPYADLGVGPRDFAVPRSLPELADIFGNLGGAGSVAPWQVAAVFAHVQAEAGAGSGGGVSIDAFRRALDAAIEAAEDGAPPSWYAAAAAAAAN